MARIMAIDFGKQRTGIAITDELQMIASGLTTVETKNLLEYLSNYIKENPLELLLIGHPKTLKNKEGLIENDIKLFSEDFNKKFSSIPIKRIDERFTSKMAFQTMVDSGLKKKKRQNKSLIDEISATLILQSYLYYR